jgi:beta-galactosidase GanA
MTRRRHFALLALLCAPALAGAQQSVPELVSQDGRHALMVDGAPYLILGAQTNNSSNYPAVLPKVWPAIERLHANTLVIPVAWEQVEPSEGRFEFAFVDALIGQARARGVRLILLWFATWKNNSPSYAPEWVKLDNRRFPRVITADGRTLNSLSPLFRDTLEADKRAYVALLAHLAAVDKQRTVIMIQLENEAGTYGSARDYSDTAEAEFGQSVPDELVAAAGSAPGDWQSVFGAEADEVFHAWHIARYCGEIAAAGKAAYPLPVYVNAALRNPFDPGKAGNYESGGPTDNVLFVWKAAAPAIDLLAPDIYFRDHKTVTRVMDLYARPDNALYVAEIGNDSVFARYFFAALGRHAVGFTPFGMEYSDYSNYPLGAARVDDESLAPFADLYARFAPASRDWARLLFEHRSFGAAEPEDPADGHRQSLELGRWTAEVSYGRPMFGNPAPPGNDPPSGGVLIVEFGPDEYLVTGVDVRVEFHPSVPGAGEAPILARVEEGHFESGRWVFERVWNGDQTDWGLNFSAEPHLLKVRLASYEIEE